MIAKHNEFDVLVIAKATWWSHLRTQFATSGSSLICSLTQTEVELERESTGYRARVRVRYRHCPVSGGLKRVFTVSDGRVRGGESGIRCE